MKRFPILLVAISACASPPAERYGFVARLGVDTISVESVTRRGNKLVSDEVDRFPRVRQRHTEIELAPDGGIKHLVMDITTPSEPSSERERHVVADVVGDSVHISKEDSTGTQHVDLRTARGLTMAHIPQMYSLIDLYFAGALKRADSLKLAPGDSVRVLQFYIDREFDRFGLHEGFVRPLPGHRAELWHDWLAGVGEATFDSAYHMLTYSGARSTYKVDVTRVATPPDVAGIGARFAALETNSGGAKQLSVRDTARGSIGAASLMVDYGRPLARGRVLLGNVIPLDRVWRTGANAATQLTTSAPITLGGLRLAKGTYTLWTIPRESGAELIVNKQIGQWGTEYHESSDLGRAPLEARTVTTPVEKFTISIAPTDARHGMLVLEWGTFRWTAPIVVM
ncbi:MAG TPA: DUF2911 domain-containing protein [Gemmatimonadaceae bacterium]|nr:DUF2911 domain-containing protein [Gemmatimonadaceae bacterium]